MVKATDRTPDPTGGGVPSAGQVAVDDDGPPVPIEESTEGWGSHMPISVPDGDFATRGVRRRTTTQPRGYPTIGTPQPQPIGTPKVAATSPPPDVGGAPPRRGSQSAVEEFLSSPPTPPPEGAADYLEAQGTPVEPLHDGGMSLTPVPSGAQDMVLPSPVLVFGGGDEGAAPHEDGLAFDAASLREAARAEGLTPSPSPDYGDRTEVDVPLEVDEAEVHVDPRAFTLAPAAPQEPAFAEEGEDARPVTFPDADEMSPLAQTLAHMAQALSSPEAEAEALAEDVEIVDAPLVGEAKAQRVRSSTPPPLPMAKGPPPMPAPAETPPAVGAPTGVPSPEALAQRPRRPKRSKPWFEEVFDEDYLRTLPYMTAQQTLREVSFIEESLVLPAGAEVLDVACGYGRHAIELTQRGLNVTGLDLSLPLLIRAADECHRRGITVNFAQADMREIQFDKQFDGAYCMLTSFGYFDEETNLRVAEGIAKTLKPGARFLLDVVNRDYVAHALPSRVWWEGDGCIVLEEVDFNFHTSRIVSRRTVVFDDGRQVEHEVSVRAYSLHELGRLLRQAGFRVIEVSGGFSTRGQFFGAASRNILALAEKRSE